VRDKREHKGSYKNKSRTPTLLDVLCILYYVGLYMGAGQLSNKGGFTYLI